MPELVFSLMQLLLEAGTYLGKVLMYDPALFVEVY